MADKYKSLINKVRRNVIGAKSVNDFQIAIARGNLTNDSKVSQILAEMDARMNGLEDRQLRLEALQLRKEEINGNDGYAKLMIKKSEVDMERLKKEIAKDIRELDNLKQLYNEYQI